MKTKQIIKQAQEEVKLVISGYLMDMSKGKIDSNGNWVFKGENEFDEDLDKVLSQAITQAVVEREKELAKQLEQTILFWEKNFDEQGYEDWPSIIRSFIKYELNSKLDKLTK